ncbi:putative vacuolar protein sorting-associated protein 9b [Rosellinia necatrix]|uniref:Putative vacuolar protein sorting-associated protein 9b n=1 Tax=Rosellinia necatrix TaxID=77044 RepID=A0A1W2TH70_ROSNE|nr:putative vacuolar protein sorting-associated protein 9b [Rosellinia necatrix]
MSSSPAPKGPEPKPGSLKSTRSFQHPSISDAIDHPLSQTQRSNTFQNGTTPEVVVQGSPEAGREQKPDAFESGPTEGDEEVEVPRASVDIGIIPIELVSMTDNFIDSLSAKVHPTPPNIDNLSRIFQDFYHTAAQHIQTHIASLASRQTREHSLSASSSARASAASILRAKAASIGTKDKTKTAQAHEPEQQMLTAEELAERKRARRALEQKKVLVEEAVERRLCEGIYDRIYRHRSTQDEAQDDKLRSKTAALAVVGIGPADLGVDLGESPEDGPEVLAKKNEEISEHLEQARKDLILMNQKRYPLGKLNCLKAAHKSIVDTLSYFHPSSSADEIMPMLIYTLITMPPENLNVISDSNFIQRFRWEEKLEGETAYCLTNLEAAITFLQTVDLASLRADEASTTPSKPGISKTETFPPAFTAGLSTTTSSPVATTSENALGTRPVQTASSLRAAVQRRRLSDLIQTPAQAIGTASDTFFYTADQGIKTIGNSLNESYRFLLGKLRDSSADGREVIVPRTLDDARKLVGTPSPEDDMSLDDSVLPPRHEDADQSSATGDDKLFSLIASKRAVRDHSTDSIRSGRSASSSKKPGFTEDGKEKAAAPSPTPPTASSNPALVESMRNLGSSLNPISRLSSMGMMRGFGRTTTPATPPPNPKDPVAKVAESADLATAFPDIAPSLPPKDAPKIDPPKKRFMELQNPADLRLGEVLELLRDYRRLAGALKDMNAFKE